MSFLVQRSDVGEFRRRYRWLVLFVLLVFGGLIGRLAQLQIVEGDQHRAQARRNIVRERYLATTRGVIRDAYGRVLAANRPAHILVLGSRLGEFSSCWSNALTPNEAFIHVDVDDTAFGAAYPEVTTLGVQSDVRAFLREVLARLDVPVPSGGGLLKACTSAEVARASPCPSPP